jgi:hypothetical protein
VDPILIFGVLGLPVIILAIIAAWVLVANQLLKGIDEFKPHDRTK